MLWWLAQNTIVALLLTGVVLLVIRWARLGPAMRHALWLLVLVKLLTPPLVVWPWELPLLPVQPGSVAEGGAARRGAEETTQTEADVEVVWTVLDDSVADRSLVPGEALSLDEPSPASQLGEAAWRQPAWLATLLFDGWLAGVACMVLVHVVRIVRFRRLLDDREPAPRWLLSQVDKLALRLRVRRPVTLVLPGIHSPFIWSLVRPWLLWPAALMERLSQDSRRSVIVHELAHIRRRDHWVGWVQMAAECIWWWNPLFWFVRRQLRLDAELACDAWVVSTLPDDRRAYAEALIEVTELVSQTTAPVPALGMSGVARQDFERRLTMIMQDRVPCRIPRLGLLAIGLLAVAAFPGWSQTAKPQKKEVSIEVVAPKDAPKGGDIEARIISGGDELAGEPMKVQLYEVTGKQSGEKANAERVYSYTVQGASQAVVQDEREKRLQALEKQIDALLKEVQKLRGGSEEKSAQPGLRYRIQTATPKEGQPIRELILAPAKPGEPVKVEGRYMLARPAQAAQPAVKAEIRAVPAKPAQTETRTETRTYTTKEGPQTKAVTVRVPTKTSEATQPTTVRALARETPTKVVTLSRATYKLPREKAEAITKFLRDHVKADVLEVKADGDSLTITTTPDAQRAIGTLVGLMQSRTTSSLRLDATPKLEGRTLGVEIKPTFNYEVITKPSRPDQSSTLPKATGNTLGSLKVEAGDQMLALPVQGEALKALGRLMLPEDVIVIDGSKALTLPKKDK